MMPGTDKAASKCELLLAIMNSKIVVKNTKLKTAVHTRNTASK